MKKSILLPALTAMLAGATHLAHCGGAQTMPSAPPEATGASSVAPPPETAPVPEPVQARTAPNDAGPLEPGSITKNRFGMVDGKEVDLYTMTNSRGVTMKVTNYGTIITAFLVPDRTGKFGDIVAGYDNLQGYLKSTPYFGATVGRVANRILNGHFELEGKLYQLATNNPPNHLHGGTKGWDKVVWDVASKGATPQGPTITFTYLSKDGEEGYPGNVTASVTYALTNDNELKIVMEASTSKTTLVNMAHHTYWNLGGYDSGSIADEELSLHADKYTPGDPFVPNGVITPVRATPFDFTKPKPIGKDISLVQIKGNPVGYDHNFVVDGQSNDLRPVARVRDPKSGRVMTLEGNQPGLQFYAGIFLDGTITGKGHTYKQYDAFCLETQKFPNSINVPAWRNQVILKPGQTYKHVMVFRFGTE